MVKRDELVRFGVAMESGLLGSFDELVKRRATTRSELLRDLARAELTRHEVAGGADAVASVTLVYDHHVRGLTETLNDLQHGLGARVRSTMHVHLDDAHCLEVIVLQGPAAELRAFADRVFAIRGVKQGGIEIVGSGQTARQGMHVHVHAHDGGPDHAHPHAHGHDHAHAPAAVPDGAKRAPKPATPAQRRPGKVR